MSESIAALHAKYLALQGESARLLAQLPRNVTDDCLAIDQLVASGLRIQADGMDDCDSYGIVLDAASDIEGAVQVTRELAANTEHMRKYVAAYVRRVA